MKKSFIGQVIGIATGLIWLGLSVALLRHFNWDIVALASWIWEFFYNLVMNIADKFSESGLFNKIVG